MISYNTLPEDTWDDVTRQSILSSHFVVVSSLILVISSHILVVSSPLTFGLFLRLVSYVHGFFAQSRYSLGS